MRAIRETYCKARQAQSFDSNSGWVPAVPWIKQMASPDAQSWRASFRKDGLFFPGACFAPAIRQTPTKQTFPKKYSVVDNAATSESAQGIVERVAGSGPSEALSVWFALPTRTSFCILSVGTAGAAKGGHCRTNKIHPQKLRFHLRILSISGGIRGKNVQRQKRETRRSASCRLVGQGPREQVNAPGRISCSA